MKAITLTISVGPRPWTMDLGSGLQRPFSRINLRKSAKSVDKNFQSLKSPFKSQNQNFRINPKRPRFLSVSGILHDFRLSRHSMRHSNMNNNDFCKRPSRNRSGNRRKNSRLMGGHLAKAISCQTNTIHLDKMVSEQSRELC